MNKGILFFVCFILVSGIVYAQSLYIADPNTMECREYSGGVRPEGFSEDIGDVNDFKNIEQACAVFKCDFTGGTVLVDEKGKILERDLCRCLEGKIWNELKGCTSGGDLVTGEAVFIPEETRVNYLAIITIILIIISLVLFFIKKVRK